MTIKLSLPQAQALHRVYKFKDATGVYIPLQSEIRTFEACERKGFVEYKSISQGHPHNGYALTESGKAFVKGGH